MEQLGTASWGAPVEKRSKSSFASTNVGGNSSHSHLQSSQSEHESEDESSVTSDGESTDDITATVTHQALPTKSKTSQFELPGLSMAPRAPAEIDPLKLMHIHLTETSTVCLFDMPSICVSLEAGDETTLVKANNAKYKELKALHLNNDNFVSRGVQTFKEAQKSKDVQASNIKYANADCNTTQWGIYDAYHESTQKSNEAEGYICLI